MAAQSNPHNQPCLHFTVLNFFAAGTIVIHAHHRRSPPYKSLPASAPLPFVGGRTSELGSAALLLAHSPSSRPSSMNLQTWLQSKIVSYKRAASLRPQVNQVNGAVAYKSYAGHCPCASKGIINAVHTFTDTTSLLQQYLEYAGRRTALGSGPARNAWRRVLLATGLGLATGCRWHSCCSVSSSKSSSGDWRASMPINRSSRHTPGSPASLGGCPDCSSLLTYNRCTHVNPSDIQPIVL